MSEIPQRLYYFDGEFLTSNDFIAEQNYNIQKLKLHNRCLHTWGIASGLEVSVVQNKETHVALVQGRKRRVGATSGKLAISSGVAIDADGNEIVFDGAHPEMPVLPPTAGRYFLTIKYAETAGDKTTKRIDEIPSFSFIEASSAFDRSISLILALFDLSDTGEISNLSMDQRRHSGIVVGNAHGNSLSIRGKAQYFQLAGEVKIDAGQTTVSGTKTAFTSELRAGDEVRVDGQTRVVVTIVSDTALTVNNPWDNGGDCRVIYGSHAPFRVDAESGAPGLFISNQGDVTIASSSPDFALKVLGNVYASNISAPSDGRFKTAVQTIPEAIKKVLDLRGVQFQWDRESFPERGFLAGLRAGVIGQDIEKTFPASVHKDSQGYLSVDFGGLIGLLIEAVKEQQKEIDALKARLLDSASPSNATLP